jgi:hypothetical protein
MICSSNVFFITFRSESRSDIKVKAESGSDSGKNNFGSTTLRFKQIRIQAGYE